MKIFIQRSRSREPVRMAILSSDTKKTHVSGTKYVIPHNAPLTCNPRRHVLAAQVANARGQTIIILYIQNIYARARSPAVNLSQITRRDTRMRCPIRQIMRPNGLMVIRAPSARYPPSFLVRRRLHPSIISVASRFVRFARPDTLAHH